LITWLVCTLIMLATLGIQMVYEPLSLLGTLCGVLLVGIGFTEFIIRKLDTELSAESARLVYPTGAIAAPLLAWVLSMNLQGMLPEPGNSHLVVVLAGLSVTVFMVIRIFDIKWLPSEEEVMELEKSRHGDGA
jgi:hypothetical protein